MKRLMRISVLLAALLMTFSMPGQAQGSPRGGGGQGQAAWHGGHGGWRGGHGHGHGGWHGGWGWRVGFYYPSYRYYPSYYYPYYPRTVIQVPDSPEPVPQSATPGYWYYCRESGAYYPDVRECPGEWTPVAPSLPPPPQ